MALIGDLSGSAGKASVIGITGSVVLGGADPDLVGSPYIGTDTAFYVSGSIGAKAAGESQKNNQTITVFGGDHVVSGAIHVGHGSVGLTSLDVYGNVDGSFVATIDNDQSSNGHVLKLLTDGNGSGSRFLEMEDGDGDVLMRARADGRFGFGTAGVSSMGAGTFVVGISGGHAADIAISKRLQHLGDSNTFMDFPAADQIQYVAGGLDIVHISSGTDAPSTVVWNEGSIDLDFRVESDNKTHAWFVDASTDQVFILSGSASAKNSVDESGYSDLAFFVSGSVGTRGT